MKKNTLLIISIIVIGASCAHKITSTSHLPEEQDTKAALHLVKGQKYLVENKITTKSTSEMAGQSMESKANITSVYSIEVNDLKDDNYNMTNSISSMKMNMSTMGQDMNFDSDKKEDMNGAIGSNMKNYINQPKLVVMDKSGNVIISKQPDTSKGNEATNPTEMLIKQMGDPEQQGYGAKMAFLPISKNIKAGTSWKDSTSADGMTRVTNYSVKEIKGNTAIISIAGTEKRDTKMEMQGMTINTKTTGTFTGEESVDINTGVILQNNTSANTSGTISVMGQDIPTTITGTSATTVKLI